MSTDPPPLIAWHEMYEGSPGLELILEHPRPTFLTTDEAFSQLRHIERYVRGLGCRGVAIETRYVDRDFADEHSAYYSKSLYPYTHFCKRIHFFRAEPAAVKKAFVEILQAGAGATDKAYRESCERFSRDNYIGFSVIRPLPGSPVGRTVLVPPLHDGESVLMGGLRRYTAHLLGIELTVPALAFQQQDLGVSACATTAIWSSLHKYRDLERIPIATPAKITALACRYTLPTSGRVMPSEAGLNVEQMCQAVQGFGVSPNLLSLMTVRDALFACHLGLKSGFAPVLVVRCPDGLYHAVAVVGEVQSEPAELEVGPYIGSPTSSRIGSLVIHDDRYGPYIVAKVQGAGGQHDRAGKDEAQDSRLELLIPSAWDDPEPHVVEHLLIPMPPKVRLPFSGIRAIVLDVLTRVHVSLWAVAEADSSASRGSNFTIYYDSWIERSYKYLEGLARQNPEAGYALVRDLCERIALPRYVCVIRFHCGALDPIDVIVDTTDTHRNVSCLAVIAHRQEGVLTRCVVMDLARTYGCLVVPDSLKHLSLF